MKTRQTTTLFGAERSARRVFVLMVSTVLGLSTVVGLGCSEEKSSASRPITVTPTRIDTLVIAPVAIRPVTRATGFLAARRDVTLAAESVGVVRRRDVEEGTVVTTNLQLGTIDDVRVTLERDQARVAAEQGQIESDLPATERRMREIRLDLAEDALRRTRITSSIDGTLEEWFVDVGEWVTPGTPVARLVDHSELELILGLPENEAWKLAVNHDVTFEVEALEDETFTGYIARIGRMANEKSRLFPVEVRIANPQGRLGVGMFCRARLPMDTPSNVFVVPRDVVFRRFEEAFCYVAISDNGDDTKEAASNDDGATNALRVRERRVTLRSIPGDVARVEIVTGLDTGDRVVTRPLAELADGALVEIAREVTSP